MVVDDEEDKLFFVIKINIIVLKMDQENLKETFTNVISLAVGFF